MLGWDQPFVANCATEPLSAAPAFRFETFWLIKTEAEGTRKRPRFYVFCGQSEYPSSTLAIIGPSRIRLSLNEVSQVRNSYNVLRLLVHIDEPQLTILPFGGQIDAHQHSEAKTIQVGHLF
jgi:hypothetical protein